MKKQFIEEKENRNVDLENKMVQGGKKSSRNSQAMKNN
eukprot:CAMPEP_0170567520 /NCGR_PEP_ID=MMETSP0211-20121228/80531_1 /TAXON_ID=311385 /ORGANISM="Pseudokeronopsis sp., Strain OXSARD2" /LENGTH=37 /DNA_ID= /DNA_START= /DNA_END= /DNA_ORIENTATION=